MEKDYIIDEDYVLDERTLITGPTTQKFYIYQPSKENKKKDKMITNKQLQDNKFYVGSNAVFNRGNNGWGHKTIEGAINHARGMIQLEGKNEVFIVKIIKVVTKASAPVKIVDVK